MLTDQIYQIWAGVVVVDIVIDEKQNFEKYPLFDKQPVAGFQDRWNAVCVASTSNIPSCCVLDSVQSC